MRVATIVFLLLAVSYPGRVFCQDESHVYISNSGNDQNPGNNPQFPRQTITGADTLLKKIATSNGIVKLSLKSGDIFNEALTPSYPIQLNTYFDSPGKNDFAVLNGTDEFSTGWSIQPGTLNTYQQAISYSGFSGQIIGNYSYLFVIEIDKELEKAFPVAARRPLLLAPSLAAVDSIPGSFYEAVSNANPANIYLHTSNGSSPNSNSKYRYEVTVRYSGVYGYTNNNNRFENLWVRGYGAGYGLIPSGDDTYCNNIIFGPGAAVHHIVLKSGSINHSLFLPASQNTNLYAVVFYSLNGMSRHNSISNSMFLDIVFPAYAHTGGAGNYASLKLDSIIAFADNGIGSVFFGTSNTDTLIVNNAYADKYNTGFNNNDAEFSSISNSCFKDATYAIKYTASKAQSSINNVFIRTGLIGITLASNNSMQLKNSIIHMKYPYNNYWQKTIIYSTGDTSNYINAHNNIFISEIDNGQSVLMATANTDKGVATSHDIWDDNVYIILKGCKMNWTITNKTSNGGSAVVTSFTEWQRQSGQDKNSLFFDLSNDPRGLKAIFIDPDNGDYELANTPEGDQIRALHAGMTNPLSCFLQRPTYDEAANMILNNKLLAINSCRNPCTGATIKANYTFNPVVLNKQQIQLQWNVAEQQNIDHFEMERSLSNSNFTSIYSLAVTTDSSYSFIDNDIQLNVLYKYRLAIITKNGDKCYSLIDSAKTASDRHKISVYPSPSHGKIMVLLNGYTGPVDIGITNATGQMILMKESNLQNEVPIALDLSGKSKGVYFLKLQTIDGLFVERFVID